MNSENEIIDVALFELDDILRVVDATLASLQSETSWNEGARDVADYWAGVGFVACERYLVAVTARTGVRRKQALDKGPGLHGGKGKTVVSIINAAANAWKHEYEWLEDAQRALDNGEDEPENCRRDQALDALDGALGDNGWEYKYVNALHAICDEIAFSPLRSRLTAWRDALTSGQQSPSSG